MPLLLGAAFYAHYFLATFPQVEFRTWMGWPTGWSDFLAMLRELVTRDDPYTRSFSLWLAKWLGHVAGEQWRVTNGVLIGLVLVAAVQLHVLARRLGASPVGAGAAMVLFLFSVPTAECIGWQATILGRCALCWALAAMLVLIAALRRGANSRVGATMLVNALVTVLVMLAYNSKESAWFLVPGLWLLVIVGTPDTGAEQPFARRLPRLSLLVLPTAYMVFHHACFLAALGGDQATVEHCFSGSVRRNFSAFASVLTGLPKGPARLLVTTVLLFALWAVRDVFRVPRRPAAHGAVLGACWCVGAMTLTLMAGVPAGYYAYAPAAFWALVVVSCVRRLMAGATADVVAVAIAVASTILFVSDGFTRYRTFSKRADAFAASLGELRRHVEAPCDVHIVLTASCAPMRQLVDGALVGFARSAFARTEPEWSEHVLEVVIGRPATPVSGVYTIEFADDMSLARAWWGPRQVFPR